METTFKSKQISIIALVKWAKIRDCSKSMSMRISATQRIVEAFKKLTVAQEFPQIIASILKQAEQQGLAAKELTAIIKVIESRDN